MQTPIKHPYQRGIITLAWLSAFALLATLAAWALSWFSRAAIALVWISACLLAFFVLSLLIAWVMDARQVRQAQDFLTGQRVLLRWTYSPAEWRMLREAVWQEEKGDWKIQLGCLTLLFALAGLLTGVMIGLEEGWLEALTHGVLGAIAGGLAGGAVGVVVAGGNYRGARQAYADPIPGVVALGVDEVYSDGEYFRGNGRSSYIQAAGLSRQEWTLLELLIIVPPRPRMPSEQHWEIPVPTRYIEQVQEILPRLAPHPGAGDN